MSFTQLGDVRAYITPDGIEINIENGYTEMGWFESAINLCLVGGNMDDNATPATDKKQWMGNEDEDTAYRFRSRFLHLLNGRPITSQLLRDLGEAAGLDIVDGFGDYLDSVTCDVSIDGLNKITVYSVLKMNDGESVSVENVFYKR